MNLIAIRNLGNVWILYVIPFESVHGCMPVFVAPLYIYLFSQWRCPDFSKEVSTGVLRYLGAQPPVTETLSI